MGGGADGSSYGHDHAYIATVVATYWFVSISMVYLNKVLMSSEGISIPAPLFVTWFQCIVTALICYAAGMVGEHYKKLEAANAASGNNNKDSVASSTDGKASFFAQFPKAEYKVVTGQKVFPLSIVFVGMITFNNLCLKWVEVSFYNVARSLTIVFNVAFSSIVLSQHTSTKTMGCLAIVILGFFIGSNGEVNFSLKGTIAGVASSLFVSLNSIYTKKVLPAVDNDHWRLTYYNNVNACLMFLPLILVFEHQPVFVALVSGQFLSTLFWGAMLVAGIFGFSIGIVTVLQIKATSPLTHNISGTAKAAVQSILAFYIWKNPPTFLGVLGIFTVLGGSLLYTLVKMGESKISSKAPPATQQQSSSSVAEKDVEMQPDPSSATATKHRARTGKE
ncbi:hypothetical protein ACA910_020056 [Epithemia clementina (nom. ined.)]